MMKESVVQPLMLLFFLVIFVFSHAAAQQTFNSLDDLWNYAEDHNIQIISARANKDIADRGVSQAYGNILPVINSSGNYLDNIKIQPTLVPNDLFGGQPGTFKEVKFGMRYLYNGILSFQLNVINAQDWFNIKSARYNREIASLNISKTRRETYEQIANAYYSYLLLREIYRLSEENFVASDTTFSLAKHKFKEGLVSEIVQITAEINVEKARKAMEEAGQNESIVLNNLKMLLNFSSLDSILLKEDFRAVTISGPTSPVFVPDPEVGLSSLQAEQARNNLRLAKASLVPTLSAVYQYTAQFSTNNAFDFVNATSLPQQYWGFRINFPLFTGGTRMNQIRKMGIDFNNKQKIYESMVKQSDLTNRNILLEYHKTLTSFFKAREILALYKANDEHAGRKFGEGMISLDDRLKVYSDYVLNQNDYIQSLSDYFVQYYRVQIRQKEL